MAKPRVFVSSTYYDLKHVRASLDIFIDSLGYEPVLSEKGDIAYTSDRPLDESCYREAENSDVFVLIIGGRYGSEATSSKTMTEKEFLGRYESITRKEYESAMLKDIPTYILVEKGVHSEYQTYLRNKDRADINYAHVDSINVFFFIESILSKQRNNPIQTFERFEEIAAWLRDQWAGLFREFLRKQSEQQQLTGLTTQVAELQAVNETLKKYLEVVMLGVDSGNSKLIEREEQRLAEMRRLSVEKNNDWVQFSSAISNIPPEQMVELICSAKSFGDYAISLERSAEPRSGINKILSTLASSSTARGDFNKVRLALDCRPLRFVSDDREYFAHLDLESRMSLLDESAVLSSQISENPSDTDVDFEMEKPSPKELKVPRPKNMKSKK